MRRRLAVAALAWAAVLVLCALPAGAQTTTTDTAPASTTTTTPCTTPPTDANGWALCAVQHDTENMRAEVLTGLCILVFLAGVVVVLKVWHP